MQVEHLVQLLPFHFVSRERKALWVVSGADLVCGRWHTAVSGFESLGLRLGVTEYTCEDDVNPCGDDAFCNHTATSLLCRCKPGFQRNKRNRQCEGTQLCQRPLL